MEARLVDELPAESGWQFEPKWDGFRCLAFRQGDNIDLRAKSGKSLTRYFPEIACALKQIRASQFILDGELLIPQGRTLSFEELQARLHPSHSRIDKLSKETPAIFMCFDMLQDEKGRSLIYKPLVDRREVLERFFSANCAQARLRLSPFRRRRSEAQKWLDRAGHGALDGVVAKSVDGPYLPAERAMLKIKCLRTADCVVGGFRYETGGKLVGSMLLGLYNEKGKLDHVGFTSGIKDSERNALTRKLENLRGGDGFSGNAPGGPSRWSMERSAEWVPLKPKLVAEVQYDHITGGRFRHGTKFLRWRPDKESRRCTFDQLVQEMRPSALLRRALA